MRRQRGAQSLVGASGGGEGILKKSCRKRAKRRVSAHTAAFVHKVAIHSVSKRLLELPTNGCVICCDDEVRRSAALKIF